MFLSNRLQLQVSAAFAAVGGETNKARKLDHRCFSEGAPTNAGDALRETR
jgi:hypothetical protein